MTVSSTSTYVRLAGNDSANNIDTTFPVFDESDLVVTSIASTGISTPFVLGTDYTVSIDTDNIATVTLTATPVTGETIDVRSLIPLTQSTSVRNLSRYLPEIHEDEFDMLLRQIQDTRRIANNAVRIPDTEAGDSDLEIPGTVTQRASKLLGFAGDGKSLVVAEPGGEFDSTLRAELAAGLSVLVSPNSVDSGYQSNKIKYDITPAEQAAGVTPVNYFYIPGNIVRYGADPTGVADSSAAIQAALNQCLHGGPPVYIPAGTYQQVTPVSIDATYATTKSFLMYGDGFLSVLTIAADAENINTINYSNSLGVSYPIIRDIEFRNTYPVTAGAGSTHFHIRLTNATYARLEGIHCKSNFVDTDYNVNNHGGIWFEKPGSFPSAFMNLIDGCWVQNCQVWFDTSDSQMTNSIVWGHTCDHAIKVNNGNIGIVNNYDLTGGRGHGTVWLTTNANNCRVNGNFFDGASGTVQSGYGVYGDQQICNQVCNNIFWTMQYGGVWINDPSLWTISHNTFLNCGNKDNGIDNSDIVLNGTVSCSYNNIIGNIHYKTDARSGGAVYAVYERNGGFLPQANCIAFNMIVDTASQYQTPAILIVRSLFAGGSITIGNTGKGTETEVYGTFTATLTGCTTSPTGTIRYSRQGNTVTLYIPTIQGTSNTTAATLTGLPASITPSGAAAQFAIAVITNSGTNEFGAVSVDSAGTITLYRVGIAAFTNSGTKGLSAGTSITYQIQ